jgi:OMF family outer membrane factor
LPAPEFRIEVKPKLIVPTNPDQITINRTQPISLTEALEIAQRNSRELKDAQLQLERSRATLQEAKTGLNPTVNAEVEYTFQDSALARSVSSPNPYSQPFNGSVGVNYNLFTNGRVQADIRAAENNVRLREVEVNRVQQTIRINIVRAYYNLQNADEQVRIRQKSVENNTRSLQDTQALERAGVGTKFDVLQAEVQLAEAQQALQQAIGDQYNNRRNLARLLEFPANVDLSAADPIVQTQDWALTLEDTIITALKNRSDLDSTRLQKLIAQERARSLQAQLGPQVSVFANYGFADNFSQFGGIGLGYALGARLNLSLFDGGVAQARVNQTLADQAIADNQFEQTINQIRFEVEQAFSNLQSNRQQIQTASKAVESATEALRLARLRLSAGVGTQLEVIRTEEDLVRAEVNKLRAIVNFNQAIADLQRAINAI